MGIGKGKTEKGSGGKRGQSGKENWLFHQEEKELGRQRRRLETKEIVCRAENESGFDPTEN